MKNCICKILVKEKKNLISSYVSDELEFFYFSEGKEQNLQDVLQKGIYFTLFHLFWSTDLEIPIPWIFWLCAVLGFHFLTFLISSEEYPGIRIFQFFSRCS